MTVRTPLPPLLDEGESAAGTYQALSRELRSLGGGRAFSGLLLSGGYKACLGGLETKLRAGFASVSRVQ